MSCGGLHFVQFHLENKLPIRVATNKKMNPFWIEEPTHPDDVLAQMCARMGLAGGSGTFATLTIVQPNNDGFDARGATGNSAVTVDYESLTGFLDFAFGDLTLSSDVNFLLEAPLDKSDAGWTGTLECGP